jgi:outer membrane protein assembly factor BamA
MLSSARTSALVCAAILAVTSPSYADTPRAVNHAEETFPTVVHRIEVRGLDSTDEDVVRREIDWNENETISRAQWDLAVTRLWNTHLFDHVQATLERRDDENVAVFSLAEKFTINPLFRFASDGDVLWLQVGASDVNVAGRFQEVAVLYERFGSFQGGQLWWRDPRAFGERIDLLVQADRLVRPRPGFVLARNRSRVEVSQIAWDDRLRYGLRADGFVDRFIEPTQTEPAIPDDLTGVYVDPGLRLGRVDTVRLRMSGASVEVRPGVGLTTREPRGHYQQVNTEALAFLMLGERWNFALRATAGTSTDVPPQLRYFLGGLDVIRGYPDNHLRTHAYAAANAEVRFVAFDSKYVAFMPVVFSDAAVAEAEATTGVEDAVSAGFGLRILIPYFVKTGVRADMAFPLRGEEAPRPALGVYQLF